MSNIKEDLKIQIIAQLNLEYLSSEDIKDDQPFFGDKGFGLDSIDALEIIVLLEQHYGIKITDPSQGREIFQSINSLAEFIDKH